MSFFKKKKQTGFSKDIQECLDIIEENRKQREALTKMLEENNKKLKVILNN